MGMKPNTYLRTNSPFLREIQRWVAESVTREYDSWTKEIRGCVLMGTLVYGGYVERFLKYCVPSLMSRGNLGGFSSRPLLVIHTDEASKGKLQEALTCLFPVADVEIHSIGQDLLKLTEHHKDSRYVLLGASELIHMKRAFYRGMHYHCLFPDVVYPMNYFSRMEWLSKDHDAILSHSLNARLEDIVPHLEPNMRADVLASLALEYLHPRLDHFVMNNRKMDFPLVAHMLYASMDTVHIAGMHATAVFFHHRLLGFAPLTLNTTLDSQIPQYLPPGTRTYMPCAADGMTLVELSDAEWDSYIKREGCGIKEFALRFWVVAEGDPGFQDVLGATTEFPLAVPPPWEPLSDSEIEDNLDYIRDYIVRIHPEVERAFEMGGILEESGLNGPLYLPQDRLREHWNARALG